MSLRNSCLYFIWFCYSGCLASPDSSAGDHKVSDGMIESSTFKRLQSDKSRQLIESILHLPEVLRRSAFELLKKDHKKIFIGGNSISKKRRAIMSKKKLTTGSLLQIKLPKELGFAYGKYIDLLSLDRSFRYPNLLRVYNYRSGDTYDIDKLGKSDLLFSPLMVAGVPEVLKKGDWKIIGTAEVQPHEFAIPHFKVSEEVMTEAKESWFYVVNMDKFKNKIPATYEQVKHLELLRATGAELLPTKIAMGLLQAEGKNIQEYFELTEYFERLFYHEVIDTQPYYLQPKEIRGHALL
jgi:hypothetical protein